MNFISSLDKFYEPIELAVRNYENKAKDGQPYAISLGRNNNQFYTYKCKIINPESSETIKYIERILKSMLYFMGGYKVYLGGNTQLSKNIKEIFSENGKRKFDVEFMEKVYDFKWNVIICDYSEVPDTTYETVFVGGHTDGCRIGFDAGGSDRKVSAVVNGEVVYSEEVIWSPKLNSDPAYHYNEILKAFRTAQSKMERVDAIGISTAGIVIENQMKIASLFIKVSDEDFKKYVNDIYIRAAKEIGNNIPVFVANDGDVTALCGAMEFKENGIFGIAMGTSQATGFFNKDGGLNNGWLNELAFVPVDYNEDAMVDEWSGDYGCGVKYFSQDSVIKLAERSGITLSGSPAEKLKIIQKLMANGDKQAEEIYKTIGIYLGYSLPYYARFYDINIVLLLGRVMSGKGGDLIIKNAEEVLNKEFPDLKIRLKTPDEQNRRLGQSVAAATLPIIKK